MRHAGELGEHRPQLFGTLERLFTVRNALCVETAQLDALGFLRGESIPGALGDGPALFLGARAASIAMLLSALRT
jgi:hypothetical protein